MLRNWVTDETFEAKAGDRIVKTVEGREGMAALAQSYARLSPHRAAEIAEAFEAAGALSLEDAMAYLDSKGT